MRASKQHLPHDRSAQIRSCPVPSPRPRACSSCPSARSCSVESLIRLRPWPCTPHRHIAAKTLPLVRKACLLCHDNPSGPSRRGRMASLTRPPPPLACPFGSPSPLKDDRGSGAAHLVRPQRPDGWGRRPGRRVRRSGRIGMRRPPYPDRRRKPRWPVRRTSRATLRPGGVDRSFRMARPIFYRTSGIEVTLLFGSMRPFASALRPSFNAPNACRWASDDAIGRRQELPARGHALP